MPFSLITFLSDFTLSFILVICNAMSYLPSILEDILTPKQDRATDNFLIKECFPVFGFSWIGKYSLMGSPLSY